MTPRYPGLWALPVALVVLVVGGVWSALLLQAHDDRYAENEHAWYRGEAPPHDGVVLQAEYNAALRVGQVTQLVALPIVLFALADVAWRWRRGPRPAWFGRGTPIVFWLLLMAWALAVFTYTYRWHYGSTGGYVRHALGSAAVALALYGCTYVGRWMVGKRFADERGGLILALALAFASTLFWPLLSLLVVLPDHTSDDLLRLSLPLTVLSGFAAIALSLALALRRRPRAAAEGAPTLGG